MWRLLSLIAVLGMPVFCVGQDITTHIKDSSGTGPATEAASVVHRVIQQSAVCTADAKPFTARGAFLVAVPLGGISGQGQFAAQWNSRADWRVEVMIGSYHYIGVHHDSVRQHLPQGPYVPARVQWVLDHALRGCFAPSETDLAARLTDGTVTVDDKHNEITVEPKDLSAEYKFWVVDKTTGLLKRSGLTQYSHYEPFGSVQVPRQVDLNEFNRDAEQFKLLSLEESTPVPDKTFRLAGAPEVQQNPASVYMQAKMTGLPHVEVSKTARGQILRFYVVLAFVVGSDGNVYDARTVLSSGNTELDNDVLQTIRGMKYTPAMRDGVPVPVDIEYTYAYGGHGRRPWTSDKP